MDNDVEKYGPYEIIQSVKEKDHGFGLFTIRRLFRLLKIIFSKRISIIFLFLICLMSLLHQYLVYHVGILPSGFYRVLGNKDWNAFWMQFLKAILLIFAICFVLSCKQYITNIFYVTSREILTDKLHNLYFNNNRFYFLNTFKYAFTDNPDQRITQDIDKFCTQFSSIINPFVISPFTISYYSYNCYQATGWIGPVSVFIMFLFSVAVNKFIMKPIVSKVILQEKFEGFFRFKHMYVRTHAESIAFQDANYAEMTRADSKLFSLIKTQQSLYLSQFPLDVTVNLSSYLGSIVSYLILAYPIFSGQYNDLSSVELSVLISKNAFVSIYLISSFTNLINLSQTISEIGGLTHRVCELLDTLSKNSGVSEAEESSSYTKLQLKTSYFSGDVGDFVFQLDDVTICPPNETTPLVSNLHLDIAVGSNLLITGKSSSGKTSVFRVIKGLWPVQSGHITRKLPFLPSTVFFLPQRPVLSDGTLLELIVYPLELPKCFKMNDKDTETILRFLKFVELEHIVEKAGLNSEVEWNWDDVLSPGEAQRLSFIRLFYHRPKLAFIDEGTSALGLEMEKKIYKKCIELSITVISIGHRESLLQYHDNILNLDGKGGWTLSPI